MDRDQRDRLFATGNTLSLIVKFSIPTIVGMLITSLNIFIDRVFVGNIPSGDLGIAGISVSNPIITLIFAFAMLTGAGAGANISLSLGRGDRDMARNYMGNATIMAFVLSAIMAVTFFLFMRPLLTLFGASEGIMPYAEAYLGISLFGAIINTLAFTLNRFILAQGRPAYSMLTSMLSVAINVVLDPIFLFVFHFGVAGAAWATAIAQICSLLWQVGLFVFKKLDIRPAFRHFKLKWEIMWNTVKLGAAPALLQLMLSVIMLFLNNSLGRYGGDMAISAMGIVSAIQQVAMMPVYGINQGIQPIIGFNYGARLYKRVRRLLFQGVLLATGVISLIWLGIEIFAEPITALFGAQAEIKTMAAFDLRLFLGMLPLVGFQVVSSNYFQAVGKPGKSLLLTSSRQLLLFLPALLILPQFFELTGVVMAAPVADFVSSVLTGVFIFREMRHLRGLGDEGMARFQEIEESAIPQEGSHPL